MSALTQEDAAQIRRDVNRQLDRNQRYVELTPEQAAWYENRASDGSPLPGHPEFVARFHTGYHECAVCSTEVAGGEGECPGCRRFVEWPEPGYEDFTAGF